MIKLSAIVIAAAAANFASAQTTAIPCNSQSSDGCAPVGLSGAMTVAAADSSAGMSPSTEPSVDTQSSVVLLLEGGRGSDGSPGSRAGGGNAAGSGSGQGTGAGSGSGSVGAGPGSTAGAGGTNGAGGRAAPAARAVARDRDRPETAARAPAIRAAETPAEVIPAAAILAEIRGAWSSRTRSW